MSKIKFVHLSDTHLGYRQYGLEERFKDWGRATKQVIDYAVQNDVDLVMHSGDLFNSNRMDQDAMIQALQILEPLKKNDIPFVVIEGNHDRRRGRQKNTGMDLLQRLDYCEFLDPSGKDFSESIYQFNGYNIIGLGYPGMYLKHWIEDFAEKLPREEKNIVLLHAGIEGYIERKAYHITPESLKKLKEKSVYLALGHYHTDFVIDDWAYNPGSVEREKFDQRDNPKIFYHVEIDEGEVEVESVEIDTRPMYNFEIGANNSWPNVLSKFRDIVDTNNLKDSLMRIVVRGKLESEFKRWELEDILGDLPLVSRILDETSSEESRNEWGDMERHEIEKDILTEHFRHDFDNPEDLANFTKGLLERILDTNLSTNEEAASLAKEISSRRRGE